MSEPRPAVPHEAPPSPAPANKWAARALQKRAAASERAQEVVRGYLPNVLVGQQFRFSGKWEYHPKYGWQLQVGSLRLPSSCLPFRVPTIPLPLSSAGRNHSDSEFGRSCTTFGGLSLYGRKIMLVVTIRTQMRAGRYHMDPTFG